MEGLQDIQNKQHAQHIMYGYMIFWLRTRNNVSYGVRWMAWRKKLVHNTNQLCDLAKSLLYI